ncbi:MAG: DUF4065 domain-containing protein [Ureaplasma sp.]|nr:DUF4065 domain-containing protein [Ureaplasma sp.]
MLKNTITLAKYLLTKGIESSLKIQKMLFFFHFEELSNNLDYGFFNKKNNFQAWIYGPVNIESFFFMQKYFNNQEEKEMFFLDSEEILELDGIYEKWYEKYSNFSASQLVELSHKNESWIKARGDKSPDEPCRNYMIEDKTFCTFIDNED